MANINGIDVVNLMEELRTYSYPKTAAVNVVGGIDAITSFSQQTEMCNLFRTLHQTDILNVEVVYTGCKEEKKKDSTLSYRDLKKMFKNF